MGSTSASVKGSANQAALDEIKLAASSDREYQGLEQAMRAAVESVLQTNPACKTAIANAVKRQIIDIFNAAKAAGKPWPF